MSDVPQTGRRPRDAVGWIHRLRHHVRDAVEHQLRLVQVSVENRGGVWPDDQPDAVRLCAATARRWGVVFQRRRGLRVRGELLPVRRDQGVAVAPVVSGLRRSRSHAVRLLVSHQRYRDSRRQSGSVQSEGTVPHLLRRYSKSTPPPCNLYPPATVLLSRVGMG